MDAHSLSNYLKMLQLSGVNELFLPKGQAAITVIKPVASTPAGDKTLDQLALEYAGCQNCPLSKNRTRFVYGAGSATAPVMIIGEGPGEQEDKQGLPFVGPAGQLLTKMLQAIQLERDQVYITNTVKCRPPGNRDPLPEEAAACRGYLDEQIDIIKPRVLLLLGRVACRNLLQSEAALSQFRRTTHEYRGLPVFATFHPSALLRNPDWKRPAWEDLKKFRDYLQQTN